MLIIKLQGGLGNQMFQYAAAKALALKLGVALKLDITSALGANAWERAKTVRNYELGKFVIDDEFATDAEIRQFRLKPMKIDEYNLRTRAIRKMRTLIERLRYLGSTKYYREQTFLYDSRFWSLKDDVYLDGYFQSYKYFDAIADLLRQKFVIKPQSCKTLKLQSEEKLSPKNVSVHIRRGDFVFDKQTNAHNGVCSLEYYQLAMKCLAGKIENPKFKIFSDDLDWCKTNLKTEQQLEFVDWCDSQQEELMLMSKCAHNIIANSSFSWWGAWLNINPKKIVVAPKKWFKVSKDTSDLLPDDWLRI